MTYFPSSMVYYNSQMIEWGGSAVSERQRKLSGLRETILDRRSFIGGSDARIIMGSNEAALIQLWREKRGEAQPEDLSGNLIVQLGSATEDLNRAWYERNTGRRVIAAQRHVKHSIIPYMAATLDGVIEGANAISRPSSCCPGHSRKRPRSRST